MHFARGRAGPAAPRDASDQRLAHRRRRQRAKNEQGCERNADNRKNQHDNLLATTTPQLLGATPDDWKTVSQNLIENHRNRVSTSLSITAFAMIEIMPIFIGFFASPSAPPR
jgi:hypothetical protein